MLKQLTALALAATSGSALAQGDTLFRGGPVFETFGTHAPVGGAETFGDATRFKVAFDNNVAAKPGERSFSLEMAARFINVHVAAGVPRENIEVAMVVHGVACPDLLTDKAWAARGLGPVNPSSAMVREMIAKGVVFYIAGQSTADLGIVNDDLIPGVKVTLAAMTAHALLQQQGYTLNPF